jgi:predicted Zn-dependent protease with MMP-like domain
MTGRRAPSLGDIEALAASALETIPEEFKQHLGPLVIRVDEFPDERRRWSSKARSIS